jgi:hypothetical protein
VTPRTRPPVVPPAVPAPVLTVAVVPEEGVAGLGLELPVGADTEAPAELGKLTETTEPRPDEVEPPTEAEPLDCVDPPT